MVDVYKLEPEMRSTKYRLTANGARWKQNQLRCKCASVRWSCRSRTVYRSEHGPVIKNDKALFAIRYGGIDNLGQLDAYYRLNKAETLDEWGGIDARMDIPSTNFIYADKEGNIAYLYNASIPNRQAGPDWRGILPGMIAA